MGVKDEKPRPKFKWVAGKEYICTHSASPAYKVGDVVKCYVNGKGWKCIRGRDGLEDICSMLVSSFRLGAEKPVDTHLRTV